jgi:molybdopterin converting factor small subunit
MPSESEQNELERAVEKRAPVQGWPEGIPWHMHLRAYEGYCKKWSAQPALIDLEGRNCRGGFGTGALDMFIPGWRDELSGWTAMKAQLSKLKKENERLTILTEDQEHDAGNREGELKAALETVEELQAELSKARERIAGLEEAIRPLLTLAEDAYHHGNLHALNDGDGWAEIMAVRNALLQEKGCTDTHNSIQAEPELALMRVEDAEFGEAADDYALSALDALADTGGGEPIDWLAELASWAAPTPQPTQRPTREEVTDEMVLAACRVAAPALFKAGLEPHSRDGPATISHMRETADRSRKMLAAALALFPASSVPKGMVLVPKEPTEAMIVAATDYCKDHGVWLGDGRFMRMYRAMISDSQIGEDK